MKIAISISGQPRNYKQGYEELKKWFLDKYDCDVFIHTWYDISNPLSGGHSFAQTKQYNFVEEDYENILKLYKPKNYNFQRPITFDNTGVTNKFGFKLNSILSAFYSIQSSYQLIEEVEEYYDYVIRTRFDLQFTDYISPECVFLDDISKLNPNELNFFSYENNDPSVRPCEIDDLFGISSMKIMKTYSETFSWILYYLYLGTEYKKWIDDIIYVPQPEYIIPESFLKWHMIRNKITLNPIQSKSDYWAPHIIR